MANDQGKTLNLEREKRLDTTRTLKNFEADLLKVREDLKEVIRARDNAESGLASAQKQAAIKPGACKRLRGSCRSPRSRLLT